MCQVDETLHNMQERAAMYTSVRLWMTSKRQLAAGSTAPHLKLLGFHGICA